MIDTLIIGDTHFEEGPDGYLESQVKALESLILKRGPDLVIFLGDIFHHRKPTPSCIVRVVKFFTKISTMVDHTIILRGNHDSSNKSDSGDTVLELFNYVSRNIDIITRPSYIGELNLHLIPHYEDEEEIKSYLKRLKRTSGSLTLGHFGFDGCMALANDYTFTIDKSLLTGPTILGHIHNFSDHGNVKILGTPYGTNFGEADRTHFVASIPYYPDLGAWGWQEFDLIQSNEGPRYMILPYESLESYESELSNNSRYTLLRVILNKFSEESIPSLKSDILKKYNISYVDFKFQPIYDKKLNNRISDYDPQVALESINDSIIDKYLEEQKSSIPTEELKRGLDIINNHANSQDQS